MKGSLSGSTYINSSYCQIFNWYIFFAKIVKQLKEKTVVPVWPYDKKVFLPEEFFFHFLKFPDQLVD